MAYRMQASVPELMDLSHDPASTFALYHRGWDQHNQLADHLPKQCRDVDQASAALVLDLQQRGLLDETLVVRLKRGLQKNLS